jgi:hypothetical protein
MKTTILDLTVCGLSRQLVLRPGNTLAGGSARLENRLPKNDAAG